MKVLQKSTPLLQSALRPTLAHHLNARTIVPHLQTARQPQARRTFLPDLNPFGASSSSTAPQTYSATRTLPYAPGPIYAIIADVSSYSSFLPFCSASTVTQWSAPDAALRKQWPHQATLVVGWQGISESFHSRVYCVPERIVEAVSGNSQTTLDKDLIRHHLMAGEAEPPLEGKGADGDEARLLTSLNTRWTVTPLAEALEGAEAAERQVASSQTKVTLSIEFAFANPLYSAMSAAVTPKVAGKMIEAFEQRVAKLLGPPKASKEIDA
ncbi:dehydrase and lipid transport-domain-containing protein [Phyllosticta citribraziliensis]|uniref:Dehydrase and lipid transport-domain-containing protein n=1 Tax=Phyllosticta citribraziliensis TaxID=989973 RepID=A0ABR1LAH8_9PEZI